MSFYGQAPAFNEFAYMVDAFRAQFPDVDAKELPHMVRLGQAHARLGIKSKYAQAYLDSTSYKTYHALTQKYE